MSTNINLLLHTDEESLKHKKNVKIVNLVAIGCLAFVGLISLILFILIQIINPEAIRKQQEDVMAKISQFKDRQYSLFVLNNRVENIDKILATRRDLAKIMAGLLAKIPPGLSVNNFEISDKSVVISGQSKSLVTVGELVSNFTDMVHNKDIVKSLTLNSLALDSSGNTYQVSITSQL